METNKKINQILGPFIVLAVVGGLFAIVVSYVLKSVVFDNKTDEESVVVKAPVCDGGFEEYKNLVDKKQNIVLVKNKSSYAQEGKFVGLRKVITRRQGEIACGYLFVSANKDTGILDEKYDSIYVNPQGFGGHLLRPRSLEITNKTANTTEVLFNLNNIAYLTDIPYRPDSQDFEISDWSKLLNVTSKVEFMIGLSTTNPSGTINEVQIAYKCWNPETGEETNDCQLAIE